MKFHGKSKIPILREGELRYASNNHSNPKNPSLGMKWGSKGELKTTN
jgi:hypothetical protein